MLDQLADKIKKYKDKIDYLEIRAEESGGTGINFRGKKIENVTQPESFGGCVRALHKGGWGFVSFNDFTNLDSKIESAVSQAKLVGKEKSKLAEIKPLLDKVIVRFKKDPRKITLTKKVKLMEEYTDLIWSVDPSIVDSSLRYGDSFVKIYFASSDEVFLEQEIADITAHFAMIARKADLVQAASFSVGDPIDFGIVENLQEEIKKRTQKAVELLNARPVKAGNYTVILDPKFAGIFIHEAFGHLSEGDFLYENKELKKIMVLGKKVGVERLNVVDDARLEGYRGFYEYDDEGVEARKNHLIKDGILVGRLHSRETAGKMGEKVTGNARAISYRFPPIVRMSNTYIEPDKVGFKEMIKDVKKGVYACESIGGQTDKEMFTFTAAWGYMIRDGKVAELVRDVKLLGNVFHTLLSIEAIGDDLQIEKTGGGCGKGGQGWIPVSTGGPHLRIANVTIGGK